MTKSITVEIESAGEPKGKCKEDPREHGKESPRTANRRTYLGKVVFYRFPTTKGLEDESARGGFLEVFQYKRVGS